MSWDDPFYPHSKKNGQVDSDNNNLGESNTITEKVINNQLLLGHKSDWASENKNRIPIPYT